MPVFSPPNTLEALEDALNKIRNVEVDALDRAAYVTAISEAFREICRESHDLEAAKQTELGAAIVEKAVPLFITVLTVHNGLETESLTQNCAYALRAICDARAIEPLCTKLMAVMHTEMVAPYIRAIHVLGSGNQTAIDTLRRFTGTSGIDMTERQEALSALANISKPVAGTTTAARKQL